MWFIIGIYIIENSSNIMYHKWHQHNEPSMLKSILFSLVRCGLEIGSVVWSPRTIGLIDNIEKVQTFPTYLLHIN